MTARGWSGSRRCTRGETIMSEQHPGINPGPSEPVSGRARAIQPFRVMALLARARELEAAGHDIVHMEVGEPDFATPEPILRAGREALDRGATHYTPATGLPELREAIAGWYKSRYGLAVDPRRIVITPGASGALLLASCCLVEPGDRVLLADPGYPCNRNFVRAFDGEPVMVPVEPGSGYQLTPAQVESAWTPGTRGVLLASPSNPTGTLVDAGDLAQILDTVRERGGYAVVDEIYHGLTYGAAERSALEFTDDVFVINSFSKYFGMTGWRLGWMVAPGWAVDTLDRLAQNLYIAAPTVAQHAALAAFAPDTLAILESRRGEFMRRRDFLLPALRELGFAIAAPPQGAFYLYADISGFGVGSEELCRRLLDEHGVAVTPGLDFGSHRAESHVRFAYTTSLERLATGVDRMREALRAG